MKLSAKTEYAALAMLELAMRQSTAEPVRIREIADTHGIPPRFLVQILLQLKNAGLVNSTRGAAGGYQLSKPADEVTLAMIVAVVDGVDASLTSNTASTAPAARTLLQTWQEIKQAEQDLLDGITLADLVERANEKSSPMYYI